jgi:hypothetical protein
MSEPVGLIKHEAVRKCGSLPIAPFLLGRHGGAQPKSRPG